MKKIGIVGCGWLGLHIAKYLSRNNKIYTTTTSEEKNAELLEKGFNSITIQFSDYEIFQENSSWNVISDLDTILITIPFPKRTSVDLLKNRFENISSFIKGFKNQLFIMSSIGIYPQVEMEIRENTLEEQLLNSNILFVEKLMKRNFPQINILRLGGLMGVDRILSKYKVSNPDQTVNHIHYEDICMIIERMIIKDSKSKIYNVVAPFHPTKQEIINYQKGVSEPFETQKFGRKILSDWLENDLDYKYKNPNPLIFK